MTNEAGQFILGFSYYGKKFRPSDWIERIATAFASFDTSHRLRYHPSIRPMKVEGQSCLFVADSLAEADPAAFTFIMNFANSNRLQIKKKPATTAEDSTEVLTAA